MHGLYTYLENNPSLRKPPQRFHELSHGEGFLGILRTRVNQPGFYLMDEPDAPLSFTACLGLVALLHDLAQAGSQPSSPPTRRSSPPSLAPASWNWATGASVPPGGRSFTSSVPGAAS
jgi:hypothetical protein